MRKFIALQLLLIPSLLLAGERPSSAPPIDKRLTGIESRMNAHDADLAELKKRIGVVEKNINGKTVNVVCPCGDGRKCICPANDCPCPDCPDHLSSERILEIYAQNKEAIDKIWESMADDEDGTMRKAVQVWLKRGSQFAKKSDSSRGAKSDVRVLWFTADWCGSCRNVPSQFGSSLMNQIETVDCTDTNPKPEYRVTAYPTFIKLVDGKEVSRIVGANRSTVAGWLAESNAPKETDLPSEAQPTPWTEVGKGLNLLKPKSSEVLVDFGCGYDARFLTSAARFYNVQKLVGVEIDGDRADSARRHVSAADLEDRITILDGDATKTNVNANVGMAYLWPDTLAELRPKIEKMDRFVSYSHAVPGLSMTKHGNWYLYTKPTMTTVTRSQPVYTTRSQPVYTTQYPARSGAVWGGQVYSGPVCNSPGCSMCNSIRQQLYYQ